MPGRITCVGAVNVDQPLLVPHLVRAGETVGVLDVQAESLGGKGANQAVAIARAGSPVTLGGRIGRDGTRWLPELAGVDLYLLGVDELQVTPSGENAILLLPGANHALQQEQLDPILRTLRPEDWLLLQNELHPTATRALLEGAARVPQLRTMINAAPGTFGPPMLPLWPLLGAVSQLYLVVNAGEAAQLWQQLAAERSASASSDAAAPEVEEEDVSARPEYAARQLAALLPPRLRALVITLGAQGAVGLWREEGESEVLPTNVQHFPACSHILTIRDTTGAGDTFVGYLLAQLAQSQSFPASMRLAITASGMACEQRGALPSIPLLADVLARHAL